MPVEELGLGQNMPNALAIKFSRLRTEVTVVFMQVVFLKVPINACKNSVWKPSARDPQALVGQVVGEDT